MRGVELRLSVGELLRLGVALGFGGERVDDGVDALDVVRGRDELADLLPLFIAELGAVGGLVDHGAGPTGELGQRLLQLGVDLRGLGAGDVEAVRKLTAAQQECGERRARG